MPNTINKTGFKNISFVVRYGYYRYHFAVNGIRYAREGFKTAEEAFLAMAMAPVSHALSKTKRGSYRTGYPGVSKEGRKFRAKFKGKSIGCFNTPEEAHEAYTKAKSSTPYGKQYKYDRNS